MFAIISKAGGFVFIILLGYLLKRIGVFKAEDFSVLSKIVIRITLPAAIITSFAGQSIDFAMLSLLLLGLGCGVLYIGLGFLLNLKSSPEKRAFEILNLPGYNIGCFTIPFVSSFLGPTGMIATSLFDSGNAFICLGGAFGVAQSVKDGGRGLDVKRILKALGKSVPFLTYITMVVLNLARIPVPGFVVSWAGIIGGANSFLAMFMIGVGFQLSGEKSQRGAIVRLLGVRFGVAAIVAAVFYFVLPFALEVRQALVLLAFSPIGSAVPPFTAELGGDVGLSSAVNSMAILISIVIDVVLLAVML